MTVHDGGRKIRRIVIDTDIVTDDVARVVPLLAGHLAGLAADTFGDVDELGEFHGLPDDGGGEVVAERG